METNPSFREDDQREMEEESNVGVKAAKSKDIRSYLCKYCGISRSKKYLITSHINSHHQMEVEEERDDEASCDGEVSCKHTCNECSAQFKKLAHLKQHMQSHSLEEMNSFFRLNTKCPCVCYCVRHWIPKERTPKCKALHVMD